MLKLGGGGGGGRGGTQSWGEIPVRSAPLPLHTTLTVCHLHKNLCLIDCELYIL